MHDDDDNNLAYSNFAWYSICEEVYNCWAVVEWFHPSNANITWKLAHRAPFNYIDSAGSAVVGLYFQLTSYYRV